MKIKAWQLGVRDGIESPDDLGSGMTWDNEGMNEWYDRGVNVGQALIRAGRAIRVLIRAFCGKSLEA